MMAVGRDQVDPLIGKKVRVATRAFHHLVGQLIGLRNERVIVNVGGREYSIEWDSVVSLTQAFSEESEFVK